MDSYADECRTDLNHPSIRHRNASIETSSGLIHFSSSLDLLASVAVDEGLQLSQSPSAIGGFGMKQSDPVSMGACSSGSPQNLGHLTISLNNTQIPHANDKKKAVPKNLIFGGGQIHASVELQYLDMSRRQNPHLARALREPPPSRHRRCRNKFNQDYTKGNIKATANRDSSEWLRRDSTVDPTVNSEHELVDGVPVEMENWYQPLRRSARKNAKFAESLQTTSSLLDTEPQRDMSSIVASPKSHKFWYWVEV